MELEIVNEGSPEVEAKNALTLKETIDSLKVVDQASYDLANEFNAQATAKKKAFHAWFDPIDDTSLKARQAVLAQRKAVDDPLDYVIKTTGNAAARWWREEQARIAEEKRIAEESARKQAEDEALRAAEILESEGLPAAAAAILEAPVIVPRVEVQRPTKADGVFYRDNWSAEVVSLADLVKAVSEGKATISALKADETYLNQWARLTKGTEAMPGVQVRNNPSQGRR